MDPYTSPNTEPMDGAGIDGLPDAAVGHHRLYDMVLKMVLWGEKKEDVYHRLEVNSVTGTTADLLYAHAWGERIATIRAAYRHKVLIGAGLIVGGLAVFSACWFGLHFIPRVLMMICFGAVGIGAWKTIDGLAGYVMAGKRQGSVTEEV